MFFNKERKARILPILLVAFVLPFMIFIVSPMEIYKNGMKELIFSLTDFIFILALVSLFCTVAIFLVLFVLPKTLYRFCYAIALSTILLLFLQTNFLNGNLTSLAGDGLSGEISKKTKIVNALIWVAVYLAFICFFFLFKKRDIKAIVCLMLSFALFASQFINFIIIGAKNVGGGGTIRTK